MILIEGTTLQVTENNTLEVGSTDVQILTETTDVPVVSELVQGPEGISAYGVAVKNGFVGTEQEWLDSLNEDAKQYAVSNLNAQKGVSGGVAPLDDSQRIPVDYLPEEAALKTDLPNLAVKEEGTQLVSKTKSINFIGTSIKATNNNGDVDVVVDSVTVVNVAATMPVSIVSGYNLVLTCTGSAGLQGQTIASFEVTPSWTTPQTVPAIGNAATVSFTVAGAVGTSLSVQVVSIDTAGNRSLPVTKTATVTGNTAPQGTPVISAPTQISGSTSGQVSFSGVTDSDGTPFTFTITQTGQSYPLVFSKTSGIQQGEVVTFTAPDVASTGMDQVTTFSVRAIDAQGAQGISASIAVTILASTTMGIVLKSTGGGGGTWGYIDANGNDIAAPSASWFNTFAPYNLTDVTIDGQAMVRVPKFYYKQGVISGGVNAGKSAWWISDLPRTGFSIHPAFMSAGSEIGQFYMGKYLAYRNLSTFKIDSIASQPAGTSGITITNTRNECLARNVGGVTGFQLMNIYMWGAIQYLYLIERASMSTSASADYRGVTRLWGTLRQYADGIQYRDNGHFWMWDKNGNQTYSDTGYAGQLPGQTAGGLTFYSGALDSVFVPNTVDAISVATAPDYYSAVTPPSGSTYYPTVGGAETLATQNGMFYLVADFNSNQGNISSQGARLSKV